jgi:small subunit ribosomal protein S4
MARNLYPKNKKARRIGKDLELTTSVLKLQKKLGIPPGQHGRKGRRRVSDYAKRLMEKQRVKWIYGVLERQFHKYYVKALKNKGSTGEELLRLLERRLDNVLYRLSLVPTRAMARQLVTHGHVLVNNKKMTIPSYLTRINDVVTLTDKTLKIPHLIPFVTNKKPYVAKWLSRKAAVGKIVRMPDRNDIDADINEQLIVELYSK